MNGFLYKGSEKEGNANFLLRFLQDYSLKDGRCSRKSIGLMPYLRLKAVQKWL